MKKKHVLLPVKVGLQQQGDQPPMAFSRAVEFCKKTQRNLTSMDHLLSALIHGAKT